MAPEPHIKATRRCEFLQQFILAGNTKATRWLHDVVLRVRCVRTRSRRRHVNLREGNLYLLTYYYINEYTSALKQYGTLHFGNLRFVDYLNVGPFFLLISGKKEQVFSIKISTTNCITPYTFCFKLQCNMWTQFVHHHNVSVSVFLLLSLLCGNNYRIILSCHGTEPAFEVKQWPRYLLICLPSQVPVFFALSW